MHASEFLDSRTAVPNHGVLVLYGTERYFREEVLKRVCGSANDDGEQSLSRFSGESAELRDVMAELRTVSMFGDSRIVLIEEADPFVSANRSALEKYVVSPARGSLLILDVRTWQKSTNLYKIVDKHGLALQCAELTGNALIQWLIRTAKSEHDKVLERDAAALIVALAGEGLSLLRQEVDKLAALVGSEPAITKEDVPQVVGGWRTETTWVMLDAIRDGQPGKAVSCLGKLLKSGEAPIRILAGLTFTFRKFAEATERARTGTPLREAILASGVFPAAAGPSEAYLRRIGFERASRILGLIIEADNDLKGNSRLDPQFLLERLFVRLAG